MSDCSQRCDRVQHVSRTAGWQVPWRTQVPVWDVRDSISQALLIRHLQPVTPPCVVLVLRAGQLDFGHLGGINWPREVRRYLQQRKNSSVSTTGEFGLSYKLILLCKWKSSVTFLSAWSVKCRCCFSSMPGWATLSKCETKDSHDHHMCETFFIFILFDIFMLFYLTPFYFWWLLN